MNLKRCLLLVLSVAGSFLLNQFAFAQEDALKDPDLQEMLKEAKELQKESDSAKSPVKMSDLKKQADEIQAQQKQEEEKEKAALQKQLAGAGSRRPARLDTSHSAIPRHRSGEQENRR